MSKKKIHKKEINSAILYGANAALDSVLKSLIYAKEIFEEEYKGPAVEQQVTIKAISAIYIQVSNLKSIYNKGGMNFEKPATNSHISLDNDCGSKQSPCECNGHDRSD